jgi:hypothetical protein
MDFEAVTVNISVPGGFAGISGTWRPNNAQQEAAWEMYVELITRVTVVELRPDEGLLREALSSLYTVFGSTREILRKKGSDVAKSDDGDMSFGKLSVSVLNLVLRPVLAKWHPLLLDYESKKPDSLSPLEHERNWDRYDELRKVLEDTRGSMNQYANSLAAVAGVPSLIIQRTEQPE